MAKTPPTVSSPVAMAGWVVAEWNSIKEFERDNKPFKVEGVKADSPRWRS
jgi:hypothetical protein